MIAAIRHGREEQEEVNQALNKIQEEMRTVEEDDGVEFLGAYDDVSGALLDPKKVYNARLDEVRFIREMRLYDKVPVSECWANTGKAPIGTKWLHVSKRDMANTKHRSRFVAKEMAHDKQEGLFASTRPLKVMKMMLSCR